MNLWVRIYKQPDDHYLTYPVSEETALPFQHIRTFTCQGEEYLSFRGSDRHSIYIYRLQDGSLVKKVSFDPEDNPMDMQWWIIAR